MKIATIGFTTKSSERFFELLSRVEIGTVVDIRLKSTSQPADFARGRDLLHFRRELGLGGLRVAILTAP